MKFTCTGAVKTVQIHHYGHDCTTDLLTVDADTVKPVFYFSSFTALLINYIGNEVASCGQWGG